MFHPLAWTFWYLIDKMDRHYQRRKATVDAYVDANASGPDAQMLKLFLGSAREAARVMEAISRL
jgi:hypothetical protein